MMTTYYPPFNFGGDGVLVHLLSNELARRGHTVDVIHSLDAYRVAAPLPHLPYRDHPRVTVHGLKSRLGRLSVLATQQTGLPLTQRSRIREILQRGFDVIHYHNVSLLGAPGLLQLGDAIKLYTMHDYWLVCPTHALFRNGREPCAEPRGCPKCTLVQRRPPQAWRYTGRLTDALRNVDAFIAPSLTSLRKHHELGIAGRMVHIPNFVSDEATPLPGPATGGDREGRPYFLFVGRLERLKGLDTLIPFFREYQKAELWVAGTGSMEPAIRELVRDSQNINLLGHRSGDELRALYRDAIALVYPAVNFQVGIPRERVRGGKGAPLVVMEAYSQRTPVVAHGIGTIGALVEETGGGIVYRSEREFAEAIDLLADDATHRRDLGLAGYEAFRRMWTADAHLDRYLALIDELGQGRARASVEGGFD
jgi:glycosyltransferase involved in cell wall biosynthesis